MNFSPIARAVFEKRRLPSEATGVNLVTGESFYCPRASEKRRYEFQPNRKGSV